MDARNERSTRNKPEMLMAVIVMAGSEPIYAGFADGATIKEIIKLINRKNRRIPTQ